MRHRIKLWIVVGVVALAMLAAGVGTFAASPVSAIDGYVWSEVVGGGPFQPLGYVWSE